MGPNRSVFAVIAAMHEAGQDVNCDTLPAELRARGIYDEIGGMPFLATFIGGTGINSIPYFLPRLQEAAKKRAFLNGAQAAQRCLADGGTLEDALAIRDRHEQAMQDHRETREPKFADITALCVAGLERPKPEAGQYGPGKYLLYRGAINEIHAEPGTGKTNVALAIAADVIHSGGRVLFIDPEDTAAGIISRLLSFGCDPQAAAEHFHYIQNPDPREFQELIAWGQRIKPDLVLLDGLAEAMAAEGLDENVPADFLQYCRTRLRPFSDAGSAVLVSDHVVKSAENRGLYSRGTGAKLGRYNGAVYLCELGKPYTPTTAGSVNLRLAKDRNGGVGAKGDRICTLHFEPQENGTTTTRFSTAEAAEMWRPSGIMQKISRHLQAYPDATKTDIRALGKHGYVDQALTILAAEEFIEVIPGPRGSRMTFKLLKPFEDALL